MANSDVVTMASVVGPMAVVLWYFFRRWVERMERIESKIDEIIEAKGKLITRDEYVTGMNRVHARIDEHVAEELEFAARIARMESKAV